MKNQIKIVLLLIGMVAGYMAYEEWAYQRDVDRVHEFIQSWQHDPLR